MSLRVKKHIIPYSGIARLPLVTKAYLKGEACVSHLRQYPAEMASFPAAMADKSFDETQRNILYDSLRKQYNQHSVIPEVDCNMQSLLNPNTFTVTAAHQPCLFTGPLYVIYKILSAVKLTQELNRRFTAYHFVPVYYMGCEDHDFKEINHLHLFGKILEWDAPAGNAVGRMHLATLQPLIRELFSMLGTSKQADQLRTMISASYLKFNTLSAASRELIHRLFGPFGLLIIDGDHVDLKRQFVPEMTEELLNTPVIRCIQNAIQTEPCPEKAKWPVAPREINLFYFNGTTRERILKKGDHFVLNNSGKEFNRQEIIAELQEHPENFSPNVVLRTLYQEKILPDIAIIGGPTEVAYWLEFKGVFDYFKINYPVVLLRNSVLWIDQEISRKLNLLKLAPEDFLLPAQNWYHQFIQKKTANKLWIDEEKALLNKAFEDIVAKAGRIDQTLIPSGQAMTKRVLTELNRYEQKIQKAIKRRHADGLNSLKNVRQRLFPENTLQERYDNFIPYFLRYGFDFFQVILKEMNPMGQQILLLKETS